MTGEICTNSPGQALINIATAWLDQGVREHGSNRGRDVSWLVHDGGGNPESAPPWCAFFVSSVCRQVARAFGPGAVRYTPSGRAVSHWLNADLADRIDGQSAISVDRRGLLFVRTRLSRPASDRDRVLAGQRTQGHVGVVVDIVEATATEPAKIVAIAGNSSGSGHSRVHGSGAVAKEVIRMSDDDPAFQRLVGLVRVADPV